MFYITLFVVIVGILSVKSASFQKGPTREVCETKECHDAAEQIKKWMNPAFKPCDDFYEFVCGKSLVDTTEKQPLNSSVGWKNTIVNFHLKKFLQDENIANETRLFKLLKQFLSVCLDEESIEARGVTPAVDALRKVGGWPVLEKNWSEDDWRIEDAEIAFGAESLFRVLIFLYDDNKWTIVITAVPPPSSIPIESLLEGFKNESVKEYYKKKCDLAEAFGADKTRAETDMKDSLEFEIALYKKFNESQEFEIAASLSELQEKYGWLNWTHFFSALKLHPASFGPDDVILVLRQEFFAEVGQLINNHPKRTVANYVMGKAAESLVDYLPSKVRKIIKGEDSTGKTRYDQCADFVKDGSLAGAAMSYIARQTLEDTKAAMEITENLLTETLNEASQLKWLDEKTRTDVVNKINQTKPLVGFPADILDLKTLENMYKEVNMNTSFFFEAIMDSNSWVRKNNFEKAGRNLGYMGLQELIDMSLDQRAFYIVMTNKIVVTGEFLHYVPLFSSKVPAYVNYGNYGFIIAHELMHALDFQSEMVEPGTKTRGLNDENMERWGSVTTEAIYEQKKQCVIDKYSAFNDSKYTGQKLDGKNTFREDIADNGGLKVALQAYRKVAAKLAPEPRLPALQQYTPEQLFMISMANSFCRVVDKETMAQLLKEDEHTPHEFRMRGIAMNSPEFSNIFGCANNAPMNPTSKCEVW